VITLLIIAITLLAIDLIICVWYKNELHLIFDAANFNDISTPILTFISIIIYGIALRVTINQNKIILSQSLIRHYEKVVEELTTKAKEIKLEGAHIEKYKDIKIDAFNWVTVVSEILADLSLNKEYNEDFKKFKESNSLGQPYLMNRSYYGQVIFLTQFSTINKIWFFHDDVKLLVQMINQSKLISEDKELLKKQIKRTFLAEYIALVKFMDNHPRQIPLIPIVCFSNLGWQYEYKSLNQTDFRNSYDWFKNEIKD